MPSLTEAQFERYARHLILDEVGEDGQAKLMAARVLVVGAGGLGSPILLYLAAAGVGTLGHRRRRHGRPLQPAAPDRPSHRRASASPRSRARAARSPRSIPRSRSSRTRVRLDAANADALVGAYDLVADGSDNFATRYLLNDVCHRLGKPLVAAALSPFEGQLSTFKSYLGHAASLLPLPLPRAAAARCGAALRGSRHPRRGRRRHRHACRRPRC